MIKEIQKIWTEVSTNLVKVLASVQEVAKNKKGAHSKLQPFTTDFSFLHTYIFKRPMGKGTHCKQLIEYLRN